MALNKRQIGMDKFRRDPRRKVAVPLNIIVAAYRRGWSSMNIAIASGVSHQTVSQRIRNYEKKNGEIIRIKNPHADGREFIVPRLSWRCLQCGKPHWDRETQTKQFCGVKCSAKFHTVVSDANIEKAIRMRRNGNSWSHVSKILQYPFQSIQRRIWTYLYISGNLNKAIVQSIWYDAGIGRKHSWKWLERRTGIICTEFGPILETSSYLKNKRKPQSSWGSTMRAEEVAGK